MAAQWWNTFFLIKDYRVKDETGLSGNWFIRKTMAAGIQKYLCYKYLKAEMTESLLGSADDWAGI